VLQKQVPIFVAKKEKKQSKSTGFVVFIFRFYSGESIKKAPLKDAFAV
jgi:hypothetical protein